MNDNWISIKEHGWPDFCVYGFHTGKELMIRRESGEELKTKYQGYGIFGTGMLKDLFEDVTHWKPV